MSEVTNKLNQHMPFDDFKAECNAVDCYTDKLEAEVKELRAWKIETQLILKIDDVLDKMSKLEQSNGQGERDE